MHEKTEPLDATPGRLARAHPQVLADAERALVDARRRSAGVSGASARDTAARRDLADAVGVGLSGGGIRSATFCLGVFQALADRRLLHRIDFLSTVSGGGYFGAFLGRLFSRDWVRDVDDVECVLRGGVAKPEPTIDPQAQRRTAERHRVSPRVMEWLRQNGRYLAPRGAGDRLLMAAVIIRNWLAVQASLLVAALFFALLLQVLRLGLEVFLAGAGAVGPWLTSWRPDDGWTIWISPVAWTVPVVVLLVALPAGWAYWLLRGPLEARQPAPRPERELLPAVVLVALTTLATVAALLAAGGPMSPGAPVATFLAWSLSGVGAVVIWRLEPLFRRTPPREVPPILGVLAVLLALANLAWWAWLAGDRRTSLLCALGALPPLMALLLRRATVVLAAKDTKKTPLDSVQEGVHRDASARHRLSTWLRNSLVVAGGLTVLTLVDSLGESIVRERGLENWLIRGIIAVAGAISALAVPAGRLLPLLVGRSEARPRLPLSLVAGAAAAAILLVVSVGADALAHMVRWWGSPVDLLVQPVSAQTVRLGLVTGFVGLLAMLVGATWPFLNGSGQEPFYRARLSRSYLGASNASRYGPDGTMVDVGDTEPDDDLPLVDYFGLRPSSVGPITAKGAPLHLINVTVNDTRSRGTTGQDRKGLALGVGPCGFSVGVEHHVVFERHDLPPITGAVATLSTTTGPPAPPPVATGVASAGASGAASEPLEEHRDPPDDPTGALRVAAMRTPVSAATPSEASTAFGLAWLPSEGRRVFLGESLTLGQWTALSGAAFTTGTGYRTSFGLSFLAGFVNARLGYWWNSGHDYVQSPSRFVRSMRRLFAVQAFLADECLARFPGTTRPHWYLSDGGHFENLGGYELLRRRLGFITLIDAEADESYRLGGLEALVRKARIDFGARFHFLDRTELLLVLPHAARFGIGTLDEVVVAGHGRNAGKHNATPPPSQAHAAVAVVVYPDGQDWSLLLYVKASVTGDEDLDVRQYGAARPAFPHESTTDQFFDEAQWESYRRLGEHVGAALFAGGGPFERWSWERPEAQFRDLVARVAAKGP